MRKKSRSIVLILLTVFIILLLVIVSSRQYFIIQKAKILSLNTAFYYMQEIIDDGRKTDFEDWGKKASRLYVLQDRASQSENKMGEYNKIKTLIFNISQIENPKHEDVQELLEQAENIKVAWSTEIGQWNVKIIK